MTPLAHALKALAALQDSVGQLAASVMPGTARPYRAPHLTTEARELRDAQAREERHERVAVAPGDSPDPYAFDVADLLVQILALADAMADETAQTAGVNAMPTASSSYADPLPYLVFVKAWLDMAAEVNPDLPAKVQRKCEQYVARADALLGHMTDGQTLDALCPWCAGITDGSPIGGDRTLRVRTMPGIGPAIVCEGGHCEPDGESGTRHRGNPAWPHWEWEWLAEKIDRSRRAA